MHEPFGIRRRAGAVVLLFDGHEIPGHPVDDDLRNATRRGGDHRQTASHRLEVHNAERLVDARADERIAAVFERVELVLRQHLLDPDDVAALLIEPSHRLLDLLADFRGVGRARA